MNLVAEQVFDRITAVKYYRSYAVELGIVNLDTSYCTADCDEPLDICLVSTAREVGVIPRVLSHASHSPPVHTHRTPSRSIKLDSDCVILARWSIVCLFSTLLAQPVLAWAPAGHKISASVAYHLLPAERRAAVCEILRWHPRFAEDFQAKRPDNLPAANEDEWLFQQASIWPDMARGFRAEWKEEYHRGTWHYCNRPLFLTDADRRAMQPLLTVNLRTDPPRTPDDVWGMNILQAIERARLIALDGRAAKRERGLAMAWLFHLAGDIHQPLHAVSMFSERLFPSLLDGDRGGNLVLTKQGERLHGLWDNFPGGDIKFNTARDRAFKFLADDELTSSAKVATEIRSTKSWFDESHELAKEYGYNEEVRAYLKQLDPDVPPEERPKLTLSEDYLRTGGLVARQRVVTAGYRLAELLR